LNKSMTVLLVPAVAGTAKLLRRNPFVS